MVGWCLSPIMTLSSAYAFDLIYACNGPQDKVYATARRAARETPELQALTVVDGEHTLKAFVRNRRNAGVPVWILVQTDPEQRSPDTSELRLSWPQGMEPLNAPDLSTFWDAFETARSDTGFQCASVGTEIGP